MKSLTPLQTGLAALLTLFCILVAIGSARGETRIPAGDGCNTCGPIGINGLWGCTAMACLPLDELKGSDIYGDKDGRFVPREALKPTCEEQMEAAMRAMEPWLTHIQDPQTGIVTVPAAYVSLEEAWHLWNAVKRECWRQP